MSISPNSTCAGLHAGFYASAARNPASPALDFGTQACTYGALQSLALRAAHAIERGGAEPGWAGLLVGKTPEGYAAMIATLSAGRGYMPLSCDAPARRLADMVTRSRAGLLVVDAHGVAVLEALLELLDAPMKVVVLADDPASRQSIAGMTGKFPGCQFVPLTADAKALASVTTRLRPDCPAYLLFTSGSTGRPKGVVVTHGNVRHFLDYVAGAFVLGAADRFSQNFDFTFDLSVFDIFACFEAGACLCPPSQGEKVLPRRYITRAQLSVWFSVPSVVGTMSVTRQLEAGAFPSLRHSLFCGEALTVKAARLWQAAAPQSQVVNLYGPTEATICCTGFRFVLERDDAGDESIVPIGAPFDGLHARILGDDQAPVADGTVGELWIGGPQVAQGYLDDPEETAHRFVADPGRELRFYRTGDRVYRDGATGELRYVGRVDHQVKVRGYRVELGEVEQALRACTGCTRVVAVAWPPTGLHSKLIGVVDAGHASHRDSQDVLAQMRTRLPDYMVPDQIVFMEDMPLNDNGKIDRRASSARLHDLLAQGGVAQAADRAHLASATGAFQ